MRTIRIITQL